jgi:ribonuclease HII
MLRVHFQKELIEAGCDEAGRGCLAGPVFAAAVILPPKFRNRGINDSKQLNAEQRYKLRPFIEKNALAWAVGVVTHEEIDKINILNASFLAMHRALEQLKLEPEFLIIDGNRFNRYKEVPHKCIIEGDAQYTSIAAASILAKTYRDDYMKELHEKFPLYHWNTNKGYATKEHRNAIKEFGQCEFHRKSFTLFETQLELEFDKFD